MTNDFGSEAANKRILITGTSPYWNQTAAAQLREGTFECRLLDGRPHRTVMQWLLARQWKHIDLFYMICPTGNWLVMILLCILQKPVLVHWIGSDVLSFTSGKSSSGWRCAILRCFLRRNGRTTHLADSPELAEELLAKNISSAVIRLIPEKVQSEVMDLPKAHKVLSYWPDERKDFYQGDLVLRLAEEFPHIPFMIIGADGKDLTVSKNVQFLGRRDDIENVYRDSSVLIRIPKHDSLSMMVIEMLARGRYVLYNKPFPYCYNVQTFEEIRGALSKVLQKTEPNREGADYVREHFSPSKEGERLVNVCLSILE